MFRRSVMRTGTNLMSMGATTSLGFQSGLNWTRCANTTAVAASSSSWDGRRTYFTSSSPLLRSGDEPPMSPSDEGRVEPSLLFLAQENNIKAMRFRLEEKKTQDHLAVVNETNEEGLTALHTAAIGGFSEIVKLLIDHGAKVNVKSKEDLATPLLWAMRGSNPEVVQMLLAGGADPNLPDANGVVPLHLAAGTGQTEIVNLLLAGKADPNLAASQPSDGGAGKTTPLDYAISRNEVETAKLLLKAGATCNHAVGPQGHTVLHLASLEGNLAAVEALLEHGKDQRQGSIDINAKDKQGATPLMRAVEFGRSDVVRLLLDNEADWKLTTKDGVTPLHLAAFKGHNECAELLLGQEGLGVLVSEGVVQYGADPNALTISKTSPLKLAIERNNIQLVELLLTRGADPNIVDGYQACPLHVAAGIGAVDCVKLLLKFKADPGRINPKDGNTPLSLAKRNSKTQVIQVLEVELGLQGRLDN